MKPAKSKATYAAIQGDLQSPKVVISKKADLWIRTLIEEHNEEIGFFGIVDETVVDEVTIYTVREIFYPKHQLVTSATCEISPQGEAAMAEWVMDNRCDEDVGRIKLWGHSHHTMGTSPSTQDESQAIERMNQKESYIIRVICNKSGDMSLSFYDYERLLRFDDVQFEVETDPEEQKVRGKVLELKKINIPARTTTVTTTPKAGGHQHSSGVFRGTPPYEYPSGRQADLFRHPGGVEHTGPGSQTNVSKVDKPDKETEIVEAAEMEGLLAKWEAGFD